MPPFLRLILDALMPKKREAALAASLSFEEIAALMHPTVTHEPWMVSLFPYRDERVRALIRAAKFLGEERHLPLVGEAVAGFITEMIADRQSFSGWGTPIIIPMPVSPKRLKERGYNQVERFAEAMLPFFGDSVLYEPKALSRVERASQVKVPKSARAENVHGAFFVKNEKRAALSGRQIILLDDVIESGSTMKDARRALLASGVSDILGIALAH